MSGAAMAWLVTWSWQATALTMASAVVLRLTKRTNASTRYLAWWITLAGVLVLAVSPWSWPLVPEYASATVGEPPAALLGTLQDEGRFSLIEIASVPLWIIIVGGGLWAAYTARRLAVLARSMRRLRTAKQRCTSMPPLLERRLPLWMSVRQTGRAAQLCLSEDVATGCMLGLGAPVIALPHVLLTALTDNDLDRIVLHEYGHVQRRDDWATLAQASIETLLGWHPAVWWIGRNLRLEREVACDDWVVLRTAAPREYASSLAKVAGLAMKRPALPLASRALRSHRELTGRVERLLDPMRNVAVRPMRSVVAAATLALGSVVVLLGQTPPVVTVGVADVPATLPAFGFDASPVPMPQLASGLGGRVAWHTNGANTQTATALEKELQPPPRVANRATLLQHTELSGLRGLGSFDGLRPALAGRRPASVLRSSEPVVSAGLVFPVNVRTRKLTELRSQDTATDNRGQGPWTHIAAAGRAVGVSTSYAGVATATAFQKVGSSVARAFVGSRDH